MKRSRGRVLTTTVFSFTVSATLGLVLPLLLYLRTGTQVHIEAVLTWHVTAAGVAAMGCREAASHGSPDERRRFLWGTWVLSLLLPGFGPVSATLLALAAAIGKPRIDAQLSDSEILDAQAARTEEERRLAHTPGPGVISLIDALNDRDERLRIAATAAIDAAGVSEHAALLTSGCRNDCAYVQIWAGFRLAQLHLRKAGVVRQISAQDSERDEFARQLDLARAYLDYAQKPIHGEGYARILAEKAAHCAAAALARSGDARAAYVAGRAHMLSGDLDEAEKNLRLVPPSTPESVQAFEALADVLLAKRDFAALQALCRSPSRPPEAELDEPVAAAVRRWISGAHFAAPQRTP